MLDISLLIYEGALAAEVEVLTAIGQRVRGKGLATFTIVGATEIIEPITLDNGQIVTPEKRMRNRPPQELVMVPGFTEDKSVYSLLEARAPMDEHVLVFGQGILVFAQAGLLEGRTVCASPEMEEKITAAGAKIEETAFSKSDVFSTSLTQDGVKAWMKVWLRETGGFGNLEDLFE